MGTERGEGRLSERQRAVLAYPWSRLARLTAVRSCLLRASCSSGPKTSAGTPRKGAGRRTPNRKRLRKRTRFSAVWTSWRNPGRGGP